MKKTVIALALVTASSSAFAAVAPVTPSGPEYINSSDVKAAMDKLGYKYSEDRSGKVIIAEDQTGGHITITQDGKGEYVVAARSANGEHHGVSRIEVNGSGDIVKVDGFDADTNFNPVPDINPRIDVKDISDGTELETYQELEKAVKFISKEGNEKVSIEVTDSQGNKIDTITKADVAAIETNFENMNDSQKAEVLRQVKAMAENGQINFKDENKRPDVDDVTIDDAQDYINDRINAANGEMVSLAAAFEQQFTARMEKLESKVDQNEGKMSNGIAGVAAMSNIPVVSGQFTVGAGVGHFNGSNALAIGVSNGFENGVSVKASMSYSQGKFDQKDMVMGAGVGYSF